jgi:hypothetical protein
MKEDALQECASSFSISGYKNATIGRGNEKYC